MNDADPTDAEVAALFGGQAREVQPDEDQLAVQLVLRVIRDELMMVAKHDKVGVNQWARRLDISPSSVSRFLGGDGDFHVSTAVLYARALGRRWNFGLELDNGRTGRGNHSVHPEMIIEVVGNDRIGNTVTATATASAPTIVVRSPPASQLLPANQLKVQSVA